MQIVAAMLCDYANVREGLLTVVSGGITRLWRPDLPAPLNLSVALLVSLESTELGEDHNLQVILQDEDGERLAEANARFRSNPPTLPEPGDRPNLPFAIDLRPGRVPRYGLYSVEIAIDGEAHRALPFRVAPPSARLSR